jgi:hypothetical protein
VRIAYFVHGNGRGHAMRAREVVPALREQGHQVTVYAGGDAAPILHDLGCIEIDAFDPGPRLARRFLARVAADRRRLHAFRPDVLITDSDAPSLLAAASMSVRRISIGHGLLFAHCRLPVALPFHQRVREALNAASASWLAHHIVVVHFGELEGCDRRVVVARSVLRPALLERGTPRSDSIVVYAGQADLSAYVRELHARGHRLVVFGRAANLPAGLRIAPADTARFDAELRSCRGIVGTAGSNLVSEAGALGLPLLALAPKHMVEQRVNARLAEHEGFAIAAEAETVDISAIERFEALLARGVHKLETDLPTVTEAVLACLASE